MGGGGVSQFLIFSDMGGRGSLFAPTSRIPMCKLFRFLESWRKMWSQIGKLLLIKGVKSPRKKKFAFRQILPCKQDFLVSVLNLNITRMSDQKEKDTFHTKILSP